MKLDVMRKIDCYVGPFICNFLLFLKLFSRLKPISARLPSAESCKNILIIKFFGMGTILLSSPALRALKNRYRNAKISILTLTSNRELCEILPSIDSVIYLDINNLSGFLASFTKNILKIRKRDFDIVIDLEFLTNFSALVTLLVTLFSRPKITVGFHSPIGWRNRTHSINVSFDHSRHITEIFAKMVRSLGVEEVEISFEREKEALLRNMNAGFIQNLIEKNNLEYSDFIACVNVNAGDLCLHRRWPKEYFAEIVNELIRKQDTAVLLIGDRKDKRYVSEFKKLLQPSSRIIDICGQTSIRELINLFTGSSLFITNDSGPMHLADIAGLSTISFFGPETPYLYGPVNNRNSVFYEDFCCSPCLNIYNSKISHCRNNICLKAIRPEKVLQTIEANYLLAKEGFSNRPNIDTEEKDEVGDIKE